VQHGLRGSGSFGTPFTSTFIHTTVFAVGLTTDARQKAARDEQWEKALAQLNEAQDRPPLKQVSGAPDVPNGGDPHDCRGFILGETLRDSDWNAIQRAVGMELVDDYVLRKQEEHSHTHAHLHDDIAQIAWDDLHLDFMSGNTSPEWPANTGQELVRNNLPPQSLWAPDALRLTAMRNRHTWKKLAMQQLSTGLLIHRLLRQVKLPRHVQSGESQIAELLPQLRKVVFFTEAQRQEARRQILEAMEKLHLTDVNNAVGDIADVMPRLDQPAIPRYVQDADGDFHHICHQMNEGIRQILYSIRPGNDKTMAFAIVKICHNLLVSTSAPNLHTFNLMLSGFRRWRRPQLTDAVIAALYTHKIRPNEVTCSEVLHHYTVESRPDDFSRFVAKMRGVDDALMLANPGITINEASHGRLVRVSEQKVLQKVHPTPMVFGALIHGVLRFAGFDRALDVYYEMKADGWGLDAQALTRLLRDCVRRGDWEGGLYLWEEINSIKIKIKARDMTQAYYNMLSLCSITGNTTAFNQVLNEVARRGFDRKSIIDAATKTVRWAHKRGEGEYLAPAFAADNVLIAVSDYMNGTTSHTAEAGTTIDDDMSLQHDFEMDGIESSTKVSKLEQTPVTSSEAWASWVEHEFGKPPKRPES
jgi:hypothetical protein